MLLLSKKEGKRKNRYFDIAAAIEDGKINDLNDVQKRHLIDNLSPTPNFKFPVQTFSDKSQKDIVGKRYRKLSWFTNRNNFIAYSQKKDGIICLPCLLFPTEAEYYVRPD